ncbi:Aste57867_2387 [Aphanomyces stellatus]|uniref:Aste57867_2387 protein n=1 Tax=Aphanomyces stellatus TaxID=120398 RepID=A0A485KB70_9STRA|nr:hypothetical protein As57867_002381 [Aphanomyces stellatus]VFT79588.1 Aste57867_2387 [Aphanomyces stellatus]
MLTCRGEQPDAFVSFHKAERDCRAVSSIVLVPPDTANIEQGMYDVFFHVGETIHAMTFNGERVHIPCDNVHFVEQMLAEIKAIHTIVPRVDAAVHSSVASFKLAVLAYHKVMLQLTHLAKTATNDMAVQTIALFAFVVSALALPHAKMTLECARELDAFRESIAHVASVEEFFKRGRIRNDLRQPRPSYVTMYLTPLAPSLTSDESLDQPIRAQHEDGSLSDASAQFHNHFRTCGQAILKATNDHQVEQATIQLLKHLAVFYEDIFQGDEAVVSLRNFVQAVETADDEEKEVDQGLSPLLERFQGCVHKMMALADTALSDRDVEVHARLFVATFMLNVDADMKSDGEAGFLLAAPLSFDEIAKAVEAMRSIQEFRETIKDDPGHLWNKIMGVQIPF